MRDSKRMSAINFAFILFVAGAVLVGAVNGRLQAVTDASFQAAKDAVTLAIGLIGIMALWLGFVRILEAGGFMFTLARILKPIMTRLFPDVPPDHPAMGSMVLNISANMLGLGNAATPFGIKAMTELNKLNPFSGTATNAMCLFLAINTSSVALLPLGVIGVRAAAGSSNPASIFLPTLLATLTSTIVGIAIAKGFARIDRSYCSKGHNDNLEYKVEDENAVAQEDYSHLLIRGSGVYRISAVFLLCAFVVLAIVHALRSGDILHFIANDLISFWLMPGLMLAIMSYGLWRGVLMYEAVTEGAKQGFDIAVRIIPFLVAILVAIAMFRVSGAFDSFTHFLEPFTTLFGMPAEVVPLAVVRPLSGSGAFGVMTSIVNNSPNSYAAYVASIMMGSTETTFYVLAVYFGAVGVTRIRHALIAGLLADVAGIISASLFAAFFWSSNGI